MSTSTLPIEMPRDSKGLFNLFIPRPIRDKLNLDNVVEIVDHLAVLDDRTQDQQDYLEVLSTLIEAYERYGGNIEVEHIGPIETLKFLLEEHHMSGSDLGRLLGQRQLGSKILRGERKLSKAHLQKLADYFKVDASLFLS